MSQTLTSADVSHYYQRLAELSTLPFWQLPEITEPTGPERGHVWHWHEVYPELARSRDILDGAAAATQRRALIFRNPGLTPPAVGATPTIAAAYQISSRARPHPSTPIRCRPCDSGWPAAERA